jgi:phosphatidylglycerol:prolipoprotein diacylglycerol transferase
LELADALVIQGACLMGVGRMGNFIDGQIVGALTDVPWGVQFPDAAGVRHPVVLYDGAKNLLLIPYLLWVQRTNLKPGAMAARFVFWYAFPRIFIDLFRDYPTQRLALGTGQTLNIVMTLVGVVLLVRSRRRQLRVRPSSPVPEARRAPVWQTLAFAALLVFCLTIPSNWTQDVPARYGKRHPGLTHSWMYPQIDRAHHFSQPSKPRSPARARAVDVLRLPLPRNRLSPNADYRRGVTSMRTRSSRKNSPPQIRPAI